MNNHLDSVSGPHNPDSTIDIQNLISDHNDSLLLIESEFQKLKDLNDLILQNFDSFLIGGDLNNDTKFAKSTSQVQPASNHQSLINKSTMHPSDSINNSSFIDITNVSRTAFPQKGLPENDYNTGAFGSLYTHAQNISTNGAIESVVSPHMKHDIKRKKEIDDDYEEEEYDDFNSQEFSSIADDEEYADMQKIKNTTDGRNFSSHHGDPSMEGQKKQNADTLSSSKKDDPALKSLAKLTSRLKLEDLDIVKTGDSFLESSSPNQPEIPDDTIDSIVENHRAEHIELNLGSEKHQKSNVMVKMEDEGNLIDEPLQLQMEKLNFEKLQTKSEIDPQTVQSLKELMSKSSDLINGELEIDRNLSTIMEERGNVTQSTNGQDNVILSEKMYNYNQLVNERGNALIRNLNGVIDSFS
ncbi:hypothetical protein DASC09_020460 [Saccharomycopsis crataegensis]|uniref:Uncharacterized protein n=1 Tax=Saccharomycopsis crataegensis TaxID=43959 RepID=A0AAV5QJ60_9ASCO|nr:hypothetical protein DASC09_020460 [Saccharomycopsis crataegensis]